ncbi:hypothetical protein U1Q18_003028 [Sarracenia purpurea var. burkii]
MEFKPLSARSLRQVVEERGPPVSCFLTAIGNQGKPKLSGPIQGIVRNHGQTDAVAAVSEEPGGYDGKANAIEDIETLSRLIDLVYDGDSTDDEIEDIVLMREPIRNGANQYQNNEFYTKMC